MTTKATKHAYEPQKLGAGAGAGGRDPVPAPPAAVKAVFLALALVWFVQSAIASTALLGVIYP